MSTQQSFLVCDSSTLANFKSWAQTISTFIGTAGWTQAADTGQVNWSTIASVPGTGLYVYEIWQPGDGLTAFFLKIEYGNATSSGNNPSIRLTLSTSTNGAGTPTGSVAGPFATTSSAFTIPSSTTTYECNFYGTSGSLAIQMWRNGTNNCSQVFAIERSLNSSGSYTGTYVTLWTVGPNGGSNGISNQQSLYFSVGAAPALGSTTSNQTASVRGSVLTTGSFNGSIPIDLCSPYVGFWDQNCTVIGSGASGDFSEGVTFTATVYGATNTYMPSKNATSASHFGPGYGASVADYCLLVRTA